MTAVTAPARTDATPAAGPGGAAGPAQRGQAHPGPGPARPHPGPGHLPVHGGRRHGAGHHRGRLLRGQGRVVGLAARRRRRRHLHPLHRHHHPHHGRLPRPSGRSSPSGPTTSATSPSPSSSPSSWAWPRPTPSGPPSARPASASATTPTAPSTTCSSATTWSTWWPPSACSLLLAGRSLAGHFSAEHHDPLRSGILYFQYTNAVWYAVVTVLFVLQPGQRLMAKSAVLTQPSRIFLPISGAVAACWPSSTAPSPATGWASASTCC